MNTPNFEIARQYVLGRLQQELPDNLTYHRIHHTRDDVAPAAERLAKESGVREDELLLLLTAAYFHDLGFVEQYFHHETLGADIAAQVLPTLGYSQAQIEAIRGIIMATRLPQSPQTLLEQIMADADMDVLGREDFLERNQALRDELKSMGRLFSDHEWYASQHRFIKSHSYFTQAAHDLRDEKKAENVALLGQLFEQSQTAAAAQEIARQNIGQGSEPPLLQSTAERVAILRSVNLFAETPDEVLEEVVSLLTPVEIPAKGVIFERGQEGDCMYVIASGRVRIHDGELVLNYLGAGDIFGEMALLDAQPRVASATAEEDTHILRLSQAPFHQLLVNHGEVALGVIRVLNRFLRGRLRDMAEDFQYIQQVGRITAAAAALEAGVYDAGKLDEVCQRTDELGQLARVFQRMASEVQARERRLKQEVQQLRIQIDEVKKAQQVSEITESEYFQRLQEQVQQLRRRR